MSTEEIRDKGTKNKLKENDNGVVVEVGNNAKAQQPVYHVIS